MKLIVPRHRLPTPPGGTRRGLAVLAVLVLGGLEAGCPLLLGVDLDYAVADIDAAPDGKRGDDGSNATDSLPIADGAEAEVHDGSAAEGAPDAPDAADAADAAPQCSSGMACGPLCVAYCIAGCDAAPMTCFSSSQCVADCTVPGTCSSGADICCFGAVGFRCSPPGSCDAATCSCSSPLDCPGARQVCLSGSTCALCGQPNTQGQRCNRGGLCQEVTGACQ